ncbi:ABC transporter ATP-binding protein [Dehalococcoidia bacterium]|nr:ABC transporter ATP-binding protein [Dehalococcoidia bacterium]
METVIVVEDIIKRYGDLAAVDGVSFEVYEKEIFGIVGPNGAGKTTTIECIEGIRRPDSGGIQVLGLDPHKDRQQLLPRIGVQLQEGAGLPERIKVDETMRLFASFYDDSLPWQSLLDVFNLSEARSRYYDRLSGGQKRRFQVALALVGKPDLLFLDEPTTGLDPHGRNRFWQYMREYCDSSRSIIVTTHYLEEAQDNCDTIAIMDKGRMVARGTTSELLAAQQINTRVAITTASPLDVATLLALPKVTHVRQDGNRSEVFGLGSDLHRVILSHLEEKDIAPLKMETRGATLNDLYLLITGTEYSENGGETCE